MVAFDVESATWSFERNVQCNVANQVTDHTRTALSDPISPQFLAAGGVMGEIESISHAFQPEGRLRASNSP
jgi:hypothetical protein